MLLFWSQAETVKLQAEGFSSILNLSDTAEVVLQTIKERNIFLVFAALVQVMLLQSENILDGKIAEVFLSIVLDLLRTVLPEQFLIVLLVNLLKSLR